MPYDDNHDDYEEPNTARDSLRQLHYTMWPERYVDESSDVGEYLWQLTLEQRATRYWLALLCVLATVVPVAIVVVVQALT